MASSNSRLSQRIFRKLNLQEYTYDRANDYDFLFVISALLLRCKAELSKDIVHEALQCLLKQHPLFRATIITERDQDCKESGRYYVEMENGGSVNLHTSDLTVDEIEAAMSLERKRPLASPDGHLWRCTLLRGQWVESAIGAAEEYNAGVILSMRHSSADGLSVVRYADLLIENINNILNKTLSAKTCRVEKTAFPRPLEDILGVQTAEKSEQEPSVTHMYDLKSCFRQVDVNDSVDQANSKFLLLEIPDYVTSNMNKLSKERGANLNGALMVVICLSYIKVATDGKPIDYGAFPLAFSVSLRRYFEKGGANSLGCYDTIMISEIGIHRVSFEVEGFWKLAHQLTQDIHKELGNKTPLLYLDQSSYDEFLKQIIGKFENRAEYLANSSNFHVSNYGRLDFLKRHKHSLVSFDSIYSMVAGATSDFQISILGLDNKLYITILYETEIIKGDKAEAFKNEIMRMLEQISNTK
ncbi:uncharacterized protein [Ptychodera flava]|uniref:uncharacterized protein n=1 Tax=Ptychodera flava TaxID=63121 RepID=UPI00396A0F7B